MCKCSIISFMYITLTIVSKNYKVFDCAVIVLGFIATVANDSCGSGYYRQAHTTLLILLLRRSCTD